MHLKSLSRILAEQNRMSCVAGDDVASRLESLASNLYLQSGVLNLAVSCLSSASNDVSRVWPRVFLVSASKYMAWIAPRPKARN